MLHFHTFSPWDLGDDGGNQMTRKIPSKSHWNCLKLRAHTVVGVGGVILRASWLMIHGNFASLRCKACARRLIFDWLKPTWTRANSSLVVWPAPYACVQPYHPANFSHGCVQSWPYHRAGFVRVQLAFGLFFLSISSFTTSHKSCCAIVVIYF